MAVTPNLGLALPAHNTASWDTPLNSNFTDIDTVVGGGTATNVLTSNGALTAPTYQPINFDITDFLTSPAWLGCCEGSNYPAVTTAGGQIGTGTANEVKCWLIRLTYTFNVLKLATRINTPLAASVGSFAIYNKAATSKLIAWENFSTASGAASLNTTLGGVVQLTRGLYWAVCSCSQTGSPPATLGGYAATGTNEGVEPWNTNGTVRSGVAANPMVAGVLPATLGVISAGGGGFAALPLIILEP